MKPSWQLQVTFSKLTIETLEQGVKYVQNKCRAIYYFETYRFRCLWQTWIRLRNFASNHLINFPETSVTRIKLLESNLM